MGSKSHTAYLTTMGNDQNPLLLDVDPIPFDRIQAEHVEPAIRQALSEAQSDVDRVADDPEPASWVNTMDPLEAAADRLGRVIVKASHLMSVAQSPELREAYNAVLPDITAFWSNLQLDPRLWSRLSAYAETPEAVALTGLRRRHLDKTLRDFRRAGAALPSEQKDRLKQIHVELAQLGQKFSENVLDETAAFELLVTDEARLSGVPDAAKARFKQQAEEADKEGWLVTLDLPSVQPILKYCDDRELRRTMYTAHARRCQDGEYDNRPLIARILRLRDEMAEMLGYDTFADFQLAERMAGSGQRAYDFEVDLAERTRPYWERDVGQLRDAAEEAGIDELCPWDVSFLIEKTRLARYDIDEEALRPYFPLDRVQEGLFDIVARVFGYRAKHTPSEAVWHSDVDVFELADESGAVVGSFYVDWFPRKEKRPGAWMGGFVTGGRRGESFEPHIGTICGNFTPPQNGKPALLTHDEVQTLFHEFGHLLHHCTSTVEIPSRAGTNVAWDWVELPSQLLENWTWEREALDVFARHHETGEPLPDELFDKLIAARQFMGGWGQMRQLSFGIVDLELHRELAPTLRRSEGAAESDEERDRNEGARIFDHAKERFADFGPYRNHADLHILTSFSHVFAGGYAAGYYSYLWSEVLDADVFTRFKEKGVLDAETGHRFVETILSRGDSADPSELFRDFMGRDPDPEALLDRNLGEV